MNDTNETQYERIENAIKHHNKMREEAEIALLKENFKNWCRRNRWWLTLFLVLGFFPNAFFGLTWAQIAQSGNPELYHVAGPFILGFVFFIFSYILEFLIWHHIVGSPELK